MSKHIPTLKKELKERIRPALMKSRGYKNAHECPKLLKVVVNSGVNASLDKSVVEETAKEISNITGQKAVITRAKTSVSNFKVREGMPIGAKVTLRGDSMYDFLHRMISIALPGIRDFRGVPSRMDGNGNYTLGISDHTIFPEVNSDGAKRQVGMDVTMVTSANTDEEGRELLQLMGMPFRKK